ncbi:hypothetical protein JCM12298_16700 [Desulfothermus naphthae]
MLWFRRFLKKLILLIFFVNILGCGYHLISTSQITLPENITLINISKIKNPTTNPQIPTEFRTQLIDEFSKRSNKIKFVDQERTNAQLIIDIVNYSLETDVENIYEETEKSDLCMTVRCYLYNRQEKLIWDSKNISECEPLSKNASISEIKRARKKVIKDIIIKFAMQFSNNF